MREREGERGMGRHKKEREGDGEIQREGMRETAHPHVNGSMQARTSIHIHSFVHSFILSHPSSTMHSFIGPAHPQSSPSSPSHSVSIKLAEL